MLLLDGLAQRMGMVMEPSQVLAWLMDNGLACVGLAAGRYWLCGAGEIQNMAGAGAVFHEFSMVTLVMVMIDTGGDGDTMYLVPVVRPYSGNFDFSTKI